MTETYWERLRRKRDDQMKKKIEKTNVKDWYKLTEKPLKVEEPKVKSKTILYLTIAIIGISMLIAGYIASVV